MEEVILEAIERNRKPGKFREVGFVPGVLYGDDIATDTLVKFDEKALNKIINVQGASAKIWISYNNDKKFGFIKEVQRKPMTAMITHIDVQIVSKDHEIKRQIPIIFNNEEDLSNRQLQLSVYRSEIVVFGKIALIPDTINVDVTGLNAGDSIKFSDLGLDDLLMGENEETIYGMIVNKRAQEEVVAVDAEEASATK